MGGVSSDALVKRTVKRNGKPDHVHPPYPLYIPSAAVPSCATDGSILVLRNEEGDREVSLHISAGPPRRNGPRRSWQPHACPLSRSVADLLLGGLTREMRIDKPDRLGLPFLMLW